MATVGSLNIKVAIKNFFREDMVIGAVDRAEIRAMRWQGGYVRKAAQESITRPTRKSARSAPGKPPFSQTGRLKKSILFSYDKASHSVVVGPTLFSSKHGVIPGTLEHGGTTSVKAMRVEFVNGKKVFVPTGGRKTIKVKPRPFMRPALERSQDALVSIWNKSVRSR